MKKFSYRSIILILAVSLSIITIVSLIITGRTYYAEYKITDDVEYIDESSFSIDGDAVNVSNITFEDGILKFTMTPNKRGKTFINIRLNEIYSKSVSAYVHRFNVISVNDYFGSVNGDVIIPINAAIFLVCVLYLAIKWDLVI